MTEGLIGQLKRENKYRAQLQRKKETKPAITGPKWGGGEINRAINLLTGQILIE